jgi:hypothetical protein
MHGIPAIVFDYLRSVPKTGDVFSMEQGVPDRDICTFPFAALDKD